jgi:oligoribonuclease NrnB/cAMP/cGMP phosphodiesterase (DHH superfamily)
VIILDHHISFIKLVEAHEFATIKNLYYRYDINKSGATLSYDFFKERLELDRLCSFGVLQRLKEYLPCIEDDDIKAEKISYSRDVTSAMYNKYKEFNP